MGPEKHGLPKLLWENHVSPDTFLITCMFIVRWLEILSKRENEKREWKLLKLLKSIIINLKDYRVFHTSERKSIETKQICAFLSEEELLT